jgi:hypothetical protein
MKIQDPNTRLGLQECGLLEKAEAFLDELMEVGMRACGPLSSHHARRACETFAQTVGPWVVAWREDPERTAEERALFAVPLAEACRQPDPLVRYVFRALQKHIDQVAPPLPEPDLAA